MGTPVPGPQRCGLFVAERCPSGQSCKTATTCVACEGICASSEPTASSTIISIAPTTTSSIEPRTTSSIESRTVPSQTSVTATPSPSPQKCGTVWDRPCPPDQSCVTTPGCDYCSGICVPPQRCGSRGLKPCPEGRFCVNDPNKPFCSTDFDCPGYCVLLDGNDCSNEFGIACPNSQQVCVDDPSDDCFPGGGSVCLGKCTFLNGRSSADFLEE